MAYLQQNDPASTRHSMVGGRITIGRTPRTTSSWSETCGSPGTTPRSPSETGVGSRDLRSRNGSYLNDQRVTESALRDGDRIKTGGATFVFSSEHDPMATIADTDAEFSAKPALSAREQEILTLLAGARPTSRSPRRSSSASPRCGPIWTASGTRPAVGAAQS